VSENRSDRPHGLARWLSKYGLASRSEARILVRVVLREGRNRQIRRMFDLLNHPVVSLHRERVGAVRLDDLEAGRARPLTRAERERTMREAKARRPS